MSSSEEGQVIGCHSVEEFNQKMEKGNESKKLIVIDFTASWGGPCRFIAPILADIARKLPDVLFLKVDVDEVRAIRSVSQWSAGTSQVEESIHNAYCYLIERAQHFIYIEML